MARAVVAPGSLAGLSVAGLVLATAASASITTVYTKNYAGYYARTTLNPRGNLTVTAALPPVVIPGEVHQRGYVGNPPI